MDGSGIEPDSAALQTAAMTTLAHHPEPSEGIEPTPPTYEAGVLLSTLEGH